MVDERAEWTLYYSPEGFPYFYHARTNTSEWATAETLEAYPDASSQESYNDALGSSSTDSSQEKYENRLHGNTYEDQGDKYSDDDDSSNYSSESFEKYLSTTTGLLRLEKEKLKISQMLQVGHRFNFFPYLLNILRMDALMRISTRPTDNKKDTPDSADTESISSEVSDETFFSDDSDVQEIREPILAPTLVGIQRVFMDLVIRFGSLLSSRISIHGIIHVIQSFALAIARSPFFYRMWTMLFGEHISEE